VEGIEWRRLTGTHRDEVGALSGRSDVPDGARYADTLTAFQLGRNSYFVGMGGFASEVMVAAVTVNKLRRPASIEGHVDPVYRGRGLGSALLDWALAEVGTSPVAVETRSLTSAKQQLFESRGLRACAAVEHTSMPLSPPVEPTPLPPGIAVTDWDDEDGYYMYAMTFGDLPANRFALSEEAGLSLEDWLTDTKEGYFVESCSLIARTTDGEPVGFVTTNEWGPIQVGVVDAWRQRGLGRALVTWSMARLHDVPERGQRAEVSVNVDNIAAIRLFRSVGYEQDHRTSYFCPM
jgi:ribosomal protein S18 acetylase RimI-like enzyme